VNETPEDLARLQRLLDDSHERAGPHLRGIITPERRLTAAALAARLTGMRLLVLATTTREGRPLTGVVDGFFYRGEFWFGTGADALRMRHIRDRPWVSATHHEGERFAVSVHGRAEVVKLHDREHTQFWDLCRDYYGTSWDDWTGDAVLYARIRAERMFTFHLEPEAAGPEKR
jgi:general stress protein 26